MEIRPAREFDISLVLGERIHESCKQFVVDALTDCADDNSNIQQPKARRSLLVALAEVSRSSCLQM